MQNPKYFLDIYDEKCGNYFDFALVSIDERDIVYEGRFKDIGIEEENDGWFSNKMDDFFEKELGIMPDEWVIG